MSLVGDFYTPEEVAAGAPEHHGGDVPPPDIVAQQQADRREQTARLAEVMAEEIGKPAEVPYMYAKKVGDLYTPEDLAACRGELHGGDVPQPMAPTTGTGQGEPMPDVRRVWPKDPDAYDRSRGDRARGIMPGRLLDMAAEVERLTMARFDAQSELTAYMAEVAVAKSNIEIQTAAQGKNADERKAMLASALITDPTYHDAQEQVNFCQRRLAIADAALERTRNEIRLTEAWLRSLA
jgi:hypothetical protein